MDILSGIFLLFFFLFALSALAGSGTQNYCRCIREPLGNDDDELEEQRK